LKRRFTALVAALATGWACAQAPTQPGDSTATAREPGGPAATPSTEVAARACCTALAGAVVTLEIVETLNSSRNARGDAFAIRVVEAVTSDGVVVIPAGTVGRGEVVHAAAARGGGAPGELLIAARSLALPGHAAPLRGLKLGVTGGDNSGMALGVSLAAGPFALFIRGREIEIPAGTRVTAKLAADVTTAPPVPAVPTVPLSVPSPAAP
jgi:hypothetical protein